MSARDIKDGPNRRREASEVDPLDTSAYRTVTNDHPLDFSGATQLPEGLHLTTSRTSFRRRSSATRFSPITNTAVRTTSNNDNSNVNDTNEQSEAEAPTGTYKRTQTGDRIDEDEEDTEDDTDNKQEDPEPYLPDTNRRPSTATLPLNKSRKNTLTLERSETSTNTIDNDQADQDQDQDALVKTTTTKSVRHKRKKAALWKVAWMFFKVYVIIFIMFIGILSIYWGSWYDRSSHLKGIQYLVVSGESQVGDLQPLFSQTLDSLLDTSSARAIGTFHFKSTEIIEKAESNKITLYEQVVNEVHEQRYWGAIYVPENFTLDYYTALQNHDSSFNTTSIKMVYETGRKPQSVQSYVVTPMISIGKSYASLVSQYVTQPLVSQLSSSGQLDIVTESPTLLSGPWFEFIDNRPSSLTITIGPIQIGLLYILVMSFHQFNFAAALHETIRAQVRLRQYLVYHIITSHLAYFVLSLVYTLISVAFGAPFDATFGNAGFLVIWALVYVAIAAMGGINEIAALWIFAWNRPYIGFWIVFFMVLNLAPVFSPIDVLNPFFRYGYAMPMHCIHELLKVCYLNTYKGNMGRNIGILLGWIALANICLPFTLTYTKRYKIKVEERARLALDKARQESMSQQ